MRIKDAAMILLLMATFRASDCLKCYRCRFPEDSYCESGHMSPFHLVDCNASKTVSCRKTSQLSEWPLEIVPLTSEAVRGLIFRFIQFAVYFKRHTEEHVTRECSIKEENGQKCGKINYADVYMYSCVCDKDGCNSAPFSLRKNCLFSFTTAVFVSFSTLYLRFLLILR